MARLLARISSSFHLQWFTLMWTGCQGISKLTKVAKIAKNTKFRQIGCWLTYLTLMACLLRFLLRSIYILQWFTMIWISKVAKMTKKAKHYEISSKLIGASSINGLLLRFLISIFSEFTLMWTGCQGIPKASLRLQSGPKGEYDVLLLLLFCFFVSPKNLSWPQCSGIIK